MEHSHAMSGHLGQKKTILKAEEIFYWENMKVDICKYVKNCITCQQFKGSSGMQQQWQELPPVNKPLERIGIDLTDMVSGNNGYRYVLTIVDHYSRFVKFIPLPTKNTHTVVEALNSYVVDFGTPRAILSDNGGEFTSREYQEFCRTCHIQNYYITPYNPRGNGVTERLHWSLKTILATLCNGYPRQWPRHLAACQAVMNAAVHTSTGVQPYFAFFNRHAPRLIGAPLPSVDGHKDEMKVAHEVLRETHAKMSRRYLTTANRKRKTQAVGQGALVWVRCETVQQGTCRKLNPKWYGPFKVVEVIREGSAYVLENVLTGQKAQRTAEKIKPYWGCDDWLLEPTNVSSVPEEEDEPLPPHL